MGSVCSRSQLNPRAAINSFQQLQRGAEGTRLSGAPGEDPAKGTRLCASRADSWAGWKWLCPQVTAATFFSSGEVRLSRPSLTQTHFPAVVVGGRGGCHPEVTLRDIKDSSPPALAVRAAPGKGSVGLCSDQDIRARTALPRLLLPSPPFSLCSCPGSEQVEVAQTSEFLMHLEFSAPSSDSRSHPSPWQPLCWDHPGCPEAPMSTSHPTRPTAICGSPGEEPSIKIKMLGD